MRNSDRPRGRAPRDPSRRQALARLGLAGATWAAGAPALLERLAAAHEPCPAAGPAGVLERTLPLYGGGRPVPTPFGPLVGRPGLDARRFTDLSRLEPDRLVTPTSEVFVRTSAPKALAGRPSPWTIAVTGQAGGAPATIDIDALRVRSRSMGVHLIECAGNSDPQNFGLMSAVAWSGVPLAELLAPFGRPPGAAAVLVHGVDDEEPAWRSVPGASWVVPLDHPAAREAFLATGMNGEPLPLDHGAPVRLVVPGWYGCAWIKWVDELRFVGPDEPSTAQMREFAARTHQAGIPELARDYEPPVIDLAATAVRVEQRRHDGRVFYRIVGIVWGGAAPVDRLEIRFDPREPWQPVAICPPPTTHRTWSLWEFRWHPPAPGVYGIVLRAADRAIRTRRLDLSFYIRRVRIEEV